VTDSLHAIRLQTDRQVAHWLLAASRLTLDDLASPDAWSQLEQYLGVSLRKHLQGVIDRLIRSADVLNSMNRSAQTPAELVELRRRLLAFRRQFLRAETTLDYFADAIATRTNARTAALLRACDSLAYRSMSQILDPIGKPTPVVMTYIDKGLGASILKAGLRLWDAGALSPVAAVKITRHNLLRPTAVIHEAGHRLRTSPTGTRSWPRRSLRDLPKCRAKLPASGQPGRRRLPLTLWLSSTPASPALPRFMMSLPANRDISLVSRVGIVLISVC
jgi:hypothetical protein